MRSTAGAHRNHSTVPCEVIPLANIIVHRFAHLPLFSDLALEFAQQIQPWLSSDQLQEIADALNGSPEAMDCNVSLDTLPLPPPSTHREASALYDLQHDDFGVLFVDAIHGDDASNDGTKHKPLRSLSTALQHSRTRFTETDYKQIVLRRGTYHLRDTLHLTRRDSNLLITNYPSETAQLSGAVPLRNLTWTLYKKGADGKDIFQATLALSVNLTSIPGLRVNGQRAIRARYPNANPETDGFGSSLTAASWVAPVSATPLPSVEYYPDEPLRNDSAGNAAYFQRYSLGIGGVCDKFSPPAGYWCSTKHQGGGASVYRVPTGLNYDARVLPNAPYQNIGGAVVHTWRPAHWATWMV